MVEVTPTPQVTPTRQVPCQKTDCDKVYKARGTMVNHMRKHHKEVESPLGTFPPSSSAVVLQFGETEDAATQGNSHGEVNSPKVASMATYVCAFCNIHFENKEDVTKHMTETHVNVDIVSQEEAEDDDDATNKEVEAELEQEEDFMEAAKEEQEMFETLADLAENAFNPVTEKNKRDTLKDKLHRYKNIMTKKDKILKAKLEEVNKLKHDVAMSKQVETHKENLVNDKENELKAASTRFKNIEKDLKTVEDQNKTNIDSLNETIGSLTKINNELMTQIATEKSLADANTQEASAAEVEVAVEIHNEENIQGFNMSKETSGHKCNACDRIFKASSDLDRHMRDKHEEHDCIMCNKKFHSTKQAHEHICAEGQVIPQVCEKAYCKKKFVSSNALAKHIKNSHFGNQRSVCTDCGEMLDTNINMNKHMETCCREVTKEIPEKTLEVCKHWKKGRCDWGIQCRFSHVGHQESPGSEQKTTNNAPVECRNGPSCKFLARGKCDFFHHMTTRHNNREHQNSNHNGRNYQGTRDNQSTRQNTRDHRGARYNNNEHHNTRYNARGPQGASDNHREHQAGRLNQTRGQGRRQQDDRARCRFGRDCDRVPNCPFIHSMEDFPSYSKSQGFRATSRAGNFRRRN